MTQRLCRVCRQFHHLHEPWPYACRGHFPPAPHATVNIISDGLNDMLNPADGQRYSSKSAYYKAVRRAGCEIIGNDTPPTYAPKTLDDPINDIRSAVEQVNSRASRARGR